MADTAFIESLVDGFDRKGYGLKTDDNVISSLDEDTEVELLPIVEEDTVVGVEVYSNGVSVYSGKYEDEDFTEELTRVTLLELGKI